MNSDESPFDKNYSKSLAGFSELMVSNTESINEKLVCTAVGTLLQSIQGDRLNVLSVGSGNGDSDLVILGIVREEVLKRVKDRDITIVNTVVDPSKYYLCQYKEQVDKLPSPLDDGLTLFKFHNTTIEEYLKNLALDESQDVRFDLVLMIHCIMYLPKPKSTLSSIFDKHLQTYGQVICVMLQDGFLQSTFICCGLQETGVINAFAKDVLDIAQKFGWRYKDSQEVVEHQFDLTDIFDRTSTTGNIALDFITQMSNFRINASSECLEGVLQVLRNETVLNDKGRYIGIVRDCFVVLSKLS